MCVKEINNSNAIERKLILREKYGELLTLDDVVDVFKYKTVGAVRKAHKRGALPVALYRFPKRVGFFAKCDEVAEAIEMMSVSAPV